MFHRIREAYSRWLLPQEFTILPEPKENTVRALYRPEGSLESDVIVIPMRLRPSRYEGPRVAFADVFRGKEWQR